MIKERLNPQQYQINRLHTLYILDYRANTCPVMELFIRSNPSKKYHLWIKKYDFVQVVEFIFA